MTTSDQPSPDSSRNDSIAALFADSLPSESPEVVVSISHSRSSARRVTARLRRDYPEGLAVLGQDEALTASRGREEVAEAATSEAARSRRNLLFEAEEGVGVLDASLAKLQAAGSSVRIVVVVDRDTDSALASLTRSLRALAVGEPEPTESSDSAVEALQEAVGDRFTVVDGDGRAVYDDSSAAEALRAVSGARAARMSGLQAVVWLSDLRRVTEYVTSPASRFPPSIFARVVHLYDIAAERVLPEMPIRADSPAAITQRKRLSTGRARVQALLDALPAAAGAAPPEVSGPAR